MAEIRDLRLADGRVLPASLLSVRFARSGGPGGQNVNKLATKADLRLDLRRADAILGPADAARIREVLEHRLDADGNVQVISEEHRQQGRNVDAALARMEALLRGALMRPKRRRPTRPTRSSQERRLEAKQRRGQVKRMRGQPID